MNVKTSSKGGMHNLPEKAMLNLMKVSTGDSWVVRNWQEVSAWTADTAFSVLLRDLINVYHLGIKYDIPLPFNALSCRRPICSVRWEKRSRTSESNVKSPWQVKPRVFLIKTFSSQSFCEDGWPLIGAEFLSETLFYRK